MRKLFTAIGRLIAEKRSTAVWNRVICILASVVVFCTTYALILPALTMQTAKVAASITLMDELVSIVDVLPDSLDDNSDETVEYNMSLALDKYAEAENTYYEENPDGSFDTFVSKNRVYLSAVNKLKSLYGISTYALDYSPDNYPVPEGEYIIMNRWMYASDPYITQSMDPSSPPDPNTATNYTLQRNHALKPMAPSWLSGKTTLLSRSVNIMNVPADENNFYTIIDNNASRDVGKWYFEPHTESNGTVYYYISTMYNGERVYLHVESKYENGKLVTNKQGKLYVSSTVNDNWAKLYITAQTKNFNGYTQDFSGKKYTVNALGNQLVYRIANKDGYALNKLNNETFQAYGQASNSPNDWCTLARCTEPVVEDGEYAIVNRFVSENRNSSVFDLALNTISSSWEEPPVHCLRQTPVSVAGIIDNDRGIAGISDKNIPENCVWKIESVRDANGYLQYYLVSSVVDGTRKYLKISSTKNKDGLYNIYLTTDSADVDTHLDITKKIIKNASTDNPNLTNKDQCVQYIFSNSNGYILEKNFSDYFQANNKFRENYSYMTLCKAVNTLDKGSYAIFNANFKTKYANNIVDNLYMMSASYPAWRTDLFSLDGRKIDVADTLNKNDVLYDQNAQDTGIYKTKSYSAPFGGTSGQIWKFDPQDENNDGVIDYYYISSVKKGSDIDSETDDKVVYLSILSKAVSSVDAGNNNTSGKGLRIVETPDESCKILIYTAKHKNLYGAEVPQFVFSNREGYCVYKNFNEEYINGSTFTFSDAAYHSLASVGTYLPTGYYSIVNRNITENYNEGNAELGKTDFAMLNTSPHFAEGALSRVKVEIEDTSYKPDFGFYRLVNNTSATMWYFEIVQDANNGNAIIGYYISVDLNGSRKYLTINTSASAEAGQQSGIQLLDSPNEYSLFNVTAVHGPNNETQWRITNKDGVALQKANNATFQNYYLNYGSSEPYDEYFASCMTLCKSVTKMTPIKNDVSVDVKVKVFNYNQTFNNVGPGVLSTSPTTYNQGSFYAWHGVDGFMEPIYASVDGNGHWGGTGHPYMHNKLVDGMPFIKTLFHLHDANYKLFDPLEFFGRSYKLGALETKADGTPYDYKNGSLSPFFGAEAVTNRFLKGSMNDGGGLFQKDDAGFYYYDSGKNAAWFDATNQRFVLYDGTVGPSFKSGVPYNTFVSNNHKNFFPFNSVGNYGDVETPAYLIDENSNVVPYYTIVDKTDLWFGMSVEFDFYMTDDGKIADENGIMHDMEFDFVGDDDVFVYIDDHLVVDIGGSHGAIHGKINFATGEVIDNPRVTDEEANAAFALKAASDFSGGTADRPSWPKDMENNLSVSSERTRTLASILEGSGIELDGNTLAPYTKHTLKFFYMERGGHISYCRLRFNMPTIPPSDLVVEKAIPDDGSVNDALLGTVEHTYRVVTSDANGKPTDELYVQPNSQYELRDKKYEPVAGPFYTDENGLFKIKAEYSAAFHDLVNKFADTHGAHIPVYGYYVQELIPADLIEYYKVSWSDSGSFEELTRGEKIVIGGEEYYIFDTDELHASNQEYVVFKNEPSDKATLKITKLNADASHLTPDDVFDMNVQLSGASIPVGTPYTLYTLDEDGNVESSSNETVQKLGIIPLRINQRAEIDGILATTTFSVWETPHNYNPYYQTQYSGTLFKKNENVAITPDNNAKMSGEFLAGDIADIIVTNASYDTSVTLNISKHCINNEDTAEKLFSFNAVRGEFDAQTGEFTPYDGIVSGAGITVIGDTPKNADLTIGCLHINGPVQYFKISEAVSSDFDGYIYDENYYIVAVSVDDRSSVTAVYKNGNINEPVTPDDGVYTLDFENRRATKIDVSKLVTGITNSTKAFDFTAKITLDGDDYSIKSGDGYTVASDGAVSFKLKNNEAVTLLYVPVGATVEITELDNDGYSTSYAVDGNETVGDAVTVTLNNSANVNVVCTNHASYVLPNAGGSGTDFVTTIAMILIIMSGSLLLLNRFKRRRTSY